MVVITDRSIGNLDLKNYPHCDFNHSGDSFIQAYCKNRSGHEQHEGSRRLKPRNKLSKLRHQTTPMESYRRSQTTNNSRPKMKSKSVSVKIGGEYINPSTGVIATAKNCSFDRVTLQDTTTDRFFGKQFTVFNDELSANWIEFSTNNANSSKD